MLNIDKETLARIVDDAVKAEREACAEIVSRIEDRLNATRDRARRAGSHSQFLAEAALLSAGIISDEIKARGGS